MTNWEIYNLYFSVLETFLLLLFHQQYDNNGGASVRKPREFDALMISIMFCFTGAFGSLLIRNKPQLAALSRFYFIISMASAMSILAFALLSGSLLVYVGTGKHIAAEWRRGRSLTKNWSCFWRTTLRNYLNFWYVNADLFNFALLSRLFFSLLNWVW